MIIGPIEKIITNDGVFVQVSVEFGLESKKLWYCFDREFEGCITTEKHDGFLVAVLLLGMKLGEDIYIKGGISPRLYYNIVSYYMPLVRSVIPSLHFIEIFPSSFGAKEDYISGNNVITGFSAGVDSFCAIHDHFLVNVPEEYKITHFLFNNVGSHGSGKSGEALFESRFDLIKGFAKELGLPFIKVNSNLDEILGMDFQQTHAPRNISSVLLLQGLFGKYYYASTYKYQDCFAGETYDIAYIDPFSIHLLSTETLDCVSTGCQYSRVEKTLKVTKVKSSYSWLNVCVDPVDGGGNCSSCWKCNRTLFTLEMLGAIEKYENCFNLNKWKKSKKWYIPEVILNTRNNDPFVRELRELAFEKKYMYSIQDRAFGFLFRFFPQFSRLIKRVF